MENTKEKINGCEIIQSTEFVQRKGCRNLRVIMVEGWNSITPFVVAKQAEGDNEWMFGRYLKTQEEASVAFNKMTKTL